MVRTAARGAASERRPRGPAAQAARVARLDALGFAWRPKPGFDAQVT